MGAADRGEAGQFHYEWDEVGRLVTAKRWDQNVASGAQPSGVADVELHYAYDADDMRVSKRAVDTQGEESYTLYLFDSLELRRTEWNTTEQDFHLDAQTEVAYLFANGVRLARLAYEEPGDVPSINGENLHVFFELGDHLGSTSVVLDKATSELVERSTYQAYGGSESDYRPERWKHFREDYRFTGKEEDVEVGLIYFGKRFLNPLLNRWISADPLAVHGLGADPNLYAYVSGQALRGVDPLGLECGVNESCQEVGQEQGTNFGTSRDIEDESRVATEQYDETVKKSEEAASQQKMQRNLGRVKGASKAIIDTSIGSVPDGVLGGFKLGYALPDLAIAVWDDPTTLLKLNYPGYGQADLAVTKVDRATSPTEKGEAEGEEYTNLGVTLFAVLLPILVEGKLAAQAEVTAEQRQLAKEQAKRAKEVHGLLDERAQKGRTTAALQTDQCRLVGCGKRDMDPIQRRGLLPGEKEARLPRRHAEPTVITRAQQLGVKPQALGTSRVMCPECKQYVINTGGVILDDFTAVWPQNF